VEERRIVRLPASALSAGVELPLRPGSHRLTLTLTAPGGMRQARVALLRLRMPCSVCYGTDPAAPRTHYARGALVCRRGRVPGYLGDSISLERDPDSQVRKDFRQRLLMNPRIQLNETHKRA
jgi:hypothetical protein